MIRKYIVLTIYLLCYMNDNVRQKQIKLQMLEDNSMAFSDFDPWPKIVSLLLPSVFVLFYLCFTNIFIWCCCILCAPAPHTKGRNIHRGMPSWSRYSVHFLILYTHKLMQVSPASSIHLCYSWAPRISFSCIAVHFMHELFYVLVLTI